MQTRVVQSQTTDVRAPRTAIRLDGLTKRYGESIVLDGLTFDVPEHSIFGFLGPNGAGKTTTIKMLLGLAVPSAGRAEVFGMDNVKDSLAIRREVGYLAQDPLFYSHMTARETLEFTCRFFYSGSKSALRDRVDEALDLVGLPDKADRPIKGFSGGERQRLGIAQAQVSRPKLLILDEPAAALDPVGRRDVLEIMEKLKSHATIFYSTHILDDVQRVSDHVAILDRGRLVTAASTDDLLRGDGTIYEVDVRGDGARAVQALADRTWVANVEPHPRDGFTSLVINVTDERAAETELLGALMAQGVTVIDFGTKKANLEDVFLGLVERQEI